MSQRTNSPKQPTLKFQENPTFSNSGLVVKTKSPTPSQSPSPTKQNGVNSGKTSSSYEIPPRYKNFNCGDKKNRQQNEFPSSPSFKSSNNQVKRLRTRSGSNSPPPLEPKLEPIEETKLLKPKAEKGNQTKTRTRPEPVLSKEILEAKTPSVPSSPSNLTLKSQSPLVQNKFVFTPKSKPTVSVPITKTPTQIMNEYCKHFSIKTHITTPEQCHFCESYIFRPYVKTNCCGKIYHSDCLSMLYTDKISFDLKNGNTMNYIYFNCECGFSNLDKEGRNYHNLTKIFNYFELNIRNNIKV